MRFCCATPCFNAENEIEHTMLSVLNQTVFKDLTHELNYIVQDGGSKDQTVVLANHIKEKYAIAKNIHITINSEKDAGMYDALAKAFQILPDGDVWSYINAGDSYSTYAFEIVAELFSQQKVAFLTGMNCAYNERNHLVKFSLPIKYDKDLLLKGYYGTTLPFVQQESTFWNNNLQKSLDLKEFKTFRLAGDFYLWTRFIQLAPLMIVYSYLAGFKFQAGQLSEHKAPYFAEMQKICMKKSFLSKLKAFYNKILWFTIPDLFKIRLFSTIYSYDQIEKRYLIKKLK